MSVRYLSFCLLVALAVAGLGAGRASAAATRPPALPDANRQVDASAFDVSPMAFETNLGQTDSAVRYLARGAGYTVFVTDDEAVLTLPSKARRDPYAVGPLAGPTPTRAERQVLRMRLVGAREGAAAVGATRSTGTATYVVGSDPAKWRRDVETYETLRVPGVYPGVDEVLRGTQRQLEYDFEVAPGADPAAIRVRFAGQRSARVDENGDLLLDFGEGVVRQQRAFAYQSTVSGKRPVAARYAVGASGEVAIEVGEYDRSAPLVIDPILTYAEYLSGSSDDDEGRAVARDAAGYAYVVGSTQSRNFPGSGIGNPIQNDVFGSSDALVFKYDIVTGFVYRTFLGGSGSEIAYGVAVDAGGDAYVVGQTTSHDFPVTAGAFDTSPPAAAGDSEAFVAKLSPDASSLVYASYLGGAGTDVAYGVAVDAAGQAFVAGLTESSDFPVTPGAFDTTTNFEDAFVARVSASGSSLVYATLLGGTLAAALSVKVDAADHAFVCGYAQGAFPTTPGAFDRTYSGALDGFVTELAPAGASLVYSTYLGGTGEDAAWSLDLDGAGHAFVAGYTAATDFPTTQGAAQPAYAGGTHDGFVAKLASDGSSLVYGTYLGGSAGDDALGVSVDAAGAAYVVGRSASADFPDIWSGGGKTAGGGTDADDAFVAKVSPAGDDFVYAYRFGGDGEDVACGVVTSPDGKPISVGTSSSVVFTGIENTYHPNPDVFVTAFSAAGIIVSTGRAGGQGFDLASRLAVAPDGSVYALWYSESLNFPTSVAALDDDGDPRGDMVVTKLSPTGVLAAATYLGGSGSDVPIAIAVTTAGEPVVTGWTTSADYPTTPGAYDTTPGEGPDVVVTKLDASLTTPHFSTYLGGGGSDLPVGLATDGTSFYVLGQSNSVDFPTTPGAYDATPNGFDGFVAKLSADGSALGYSTFLGGSSAVTPADLDVNASGDAYVTGAATSLATTPNAYDTTPNGGTDAFVQELNPTGSSVLLATFLGGSANDAGADVDVDATGAIYVAGTTQSAGFPTTPGASDTTYGGAGDVFVTKLAPGGSSLAYSTFYGGSGADSAPRLAVDPAGDAFVVGSTLSTDLPLSPSAIFASPTPGVPSAFVARVDPTGTTLDFSSYLGGDGGDTAATDVAVGARGTVYVEGLTTSPAFTSTDGYGANDYDRVFVAKLRFSGSDAPGIFVPSTGAWFLKYVASGGGADLAFQYGGAGSGAVPLAGDWDGDGVDTPGLYVPSTGAFLLRNSSSPGGADLAFTFGAGGAGYVPIVGDWNGDGVDTVGLYQPASGVFFLRNANSGGGADVTFQLGSGGAKPLAGDWDGDGVDTVGLYVAATGVFFLKNANASGGADAVFQFGGGGSTPLAGDWNGDGIDTVGLYVSGTATWFLTDRNAPGPATRAFAFGPPGATPVVGNWDGR